MRRSEQILELALIQAKEESYKAKKRPQYDAESDVVNIQIPISITNSRWVEDRVVSSPMNSDQKNKQQWKRNVAAKARECGESCLSRKGVVIPAKRIIEDNIISNEKCRLKCSTRIKQDTKVSILNDFY
ncbi:unnamed protein product [Diabrotica balteata]|uniref:Uncharacterized protein n=1 Tax=Diabrotica balteata TaxID=107213 RepID=A0A9N9SME4_DIABA|nr:unnamed protein product [Diabrotica balteata]